MQYKFLLFIFLIGSFTCVAQEYNALDSNGKRHGKWKKMYEGTDHLRYEGTFDHGKEIGEFKFYKPSTGDKPTATKMFYPTSDTIKVRYYTHKGGVISEGNMIAKNRVGPWKYYHRSSSDVMMLENYKGGKLDGEHLTYFKNGQLTEKVSYKDGKKEGERLVYSEQGVLIKKYTYENDELHGPTKYYTPKGVIEIEGNYKRDRKDGIWNYYLNGKISEKKVFPISKRK